jgi:small-conductance mechanosensitive channel
MSEIVNLTELNSVNLIFNVDLLSSITFALVILLAGFTVGKLLEKVIFKFLRSVEFDKTLKKLNFHKLFLSRTISSFISWVIYVAAVVLALLSLNVLYWAFLVVAYFVGLIFLGTIFLGLFFSVPNFISGFKLRKYDLVGKFIVVNNVEGKVIKVGCFSIKLLSTNKELFVLPNKSVKKFHFKNEG